MTLIDTQMLMTLGLQRETAGRGTMAVYVQVRDDATQAGDPLLI